MSTRFAAGYKNPSQVARRVTEGWAETNLYCAACNSPAITAKPTNSSAVDFYCQSCSAAYQLKAMRTWNERRIPDAGYEAMMRALQSDSIPNLLVLHYGYDWRVHNLMLIPSFFFSPSAIQKRPPLGPNARRAGWVGCNILLNRISDRGKISIVANGIRIPTSEVRNRYAVFRGLSKVELPSRGWVLDVLHMIRSIGRTRFVLADVYDYEDDLSALYPGNKNIRPKIRQSLQILRDLGLLAFRGRGEYEFTH